MKIDIDEILKFSERKYKKEELNIILYNVDHNCKQIIKSKIFKNFLKKDINIDFFIIPTPNVCPAYSEFIDEKFYKIVLNKKFLIITLNYIEYLVKNNHIFKEIEGVLEILCQSDRIYSKGLNNESNN